MKSKISILPILTQATSTDGFLFTRIMDKITLYTRANCRNCQNQTILFERFLNNSKYQKVEIASEIEALRITKKYKVQHTPFIVVNDKSVIHKQDFLTLAKVFRNI